MRSNDLRFFFLQFLLNDYKVENLPLVKLCLEFGLSEYWCFPFVVIFYLQDLNIYLVYNVISLLAVNVIENMLRPLIQKNSILASYNSKICMF